MALQILLGQRPFTSLPAPNHFLRQPRRQFVGLKRLGRLEIDRAWQCGGHWKLHQSSRVPRNCVGKAGSPTIQIPSRKRERRKHEKQTEYARRLRHPVTPTELVPRFETAEATESTEKRRIREKRQSQDRLGDFS